MLVLSRKIDQVVKIGDNITVKVIRTAGNRVQLGIDAPSDVSIRREELSDVVASVGSTDGGGETATALVANVA